MRATWAACEGVGGRLQMGSCACYGLGYAHAAHLCSSACALAKCLGWAVRRCLPLCGAVASGVHRSMPSFTHVRLRSNLHGVCLMLHSKSVLILKTFRDDVGKHIRLAGAEVWAACAVLSCCIVVEEQYYCCLT